MKVKEYLEKYNLKESKHFDRESFVKDIMEDFYWLFENTSKSVHPVARFEKCITEIKQKWSSIFNKSILDYESSEKFWKFFFATKIIANRDAVFGDWKQAKHDYRMKSEPGYRHKYETWKMYSELDEFERQSFKDYFSDRLERLKQLFIPIQEELQLLNIHKDEISADLINSQYRKLSKIHHPDIGGDSKVFIKITDAKNKLLRYIGE